MNLEAVEKADGDYSVLKGYASIYGNIDHHGDIIVAGCFDESAKENPNVPILKGHYWDNQIGFNNKMTSNKTGLKVEGWLDTENNTIAREQYGLCKMSLELGRPMGLSVGFLINDSGWSEEDDLIYEIRKAKLFEYSITPMPANPKALISDAKAKQVFSDLEKEVGKSSTSLFIKRLQEKGLDEVEIASFVLNFCLKQSLYMRIKHLFSPIKVLKTGKPIDFNKKTVSNNEENIRKAFKFNI